MKTSKFLFAIALTSMTFSFASCNEDGNDEPTGRTTIGFENFTDLQMANPTSYGDNLYGDVTIDGKEWPHVYTFAGDNGYFSQLNYTEATDWAAAGYYFYNGGIVVSNWSIRENPQDKGNDWWYSYENQCSVYNAAVASGSANAGHAGSKNFAVANGSGDDANSPKLSWFEFREGDKAVEHKNVKLFVCNSAYTYGVILNGNSYSSSLVKTNGWFKVQAYGYDINGNPTNNGAPAEFFLANYSDAQNGGKKIEAISTWTEWDLSELGNVAKIKFNFRGSDAGEWGLNTPAYVCIDDISYE